jgi:hypothetical protein
MKKILIRGLFVVLILLIVAVVAIGMSLGTAIKKGVETFGPQMTKVPVTLEGVSLSIFSGAGAIKGLVIGNPEGYKTTNAMSLGLASVAVSPGSLLSDKMVVKSIRVEAPQVTFELGPGGNNLQRIQENLEASPAVSSTDAAETGGRKSPGGIQARQEVAGGRSRHQWRQSDAGRGGVGWQTDRSATGGSAVAGEDPHQDLRR